MFGIQSKWIDHVLQLHDFTCTKANKQVGVYLTSHPAYQRAMEIIDQSWLDAGMTREELDRSEIIADLFDRWLAAGNAFEDVSPFPEASVRELAPA